MMLIMGEVGGGEAGGDPVLSTINVDYLEDRRCLIFIIIINKLLTKIALKVPNLIFFVPQLNFFYCFSFLRAVR